MCSVELIATLRRVVFRWQAVALMIRHNSLLLVTNSSNHWGAGQHHRCLCVFFFFSHSVMEVVDWLL